MLQNLNDFLELHSEELRLEFHREEASSSLEDRAESDPEDTGVVEQHLKREEEGKALYENVPDFDGGRFSLRAHELYQEFLQVVQTNLEGDARTGLYSAWSASIKITGVGRRD